jgi:hypothetical protein
MSSAYMWGTHLAEELPRDLRAGIGSGRGVRLRRLRRSADYAGRDWTRLERRAAFSRAVTGAGVYVLPARFDDSELSGLLPTRLYGRRGCSFSRNSARSTIFHDSSAGGCQPLNQLSYPCRTTLAVPPCSKS